MDWLASAFSKYPELAGFLVVGDGGHRAFFAFQHLDRDDRRIGK